MRLHTTIALTTVAAIFSLIFVSAPAARAEEHVIGLCDLHDVLCPEGHGLDGAVKALAHSPSVELKNNGFFSTTEICESDTTVQSEGSKSPRTGKVTALTFTNCEGPCSTAEAKNLPWNSEVTMAELEADMYTQTTEEGSARFSTCTFGVSCEYGVPAEGSVNLLGEGNTLKANEIQLEYKGGSGEGLCGSVGTWTATYTINTCHLEDLEEHSCYLTLLTASEEHVIGFCLEAELLCEKSNGLSGEVKLLAHTNLAELTNSSLFNTPEKCKSDARVETEGMKSPLTGNVTKLLFTECSGPCSSAESTNLPWSEEVAMPAKWLGEDMYLQTMKEGAVLFSECTLGVECEYGVPFAGSVSLLGEGNAFEAQGVELEYKNGSGAGVCGSTLEWTATYTINACDLADESQHIPCYLALLAV